MGFQNQDWVSEALVCNRSRMLDASAGALARQSFISLWMVRSAVGPGQQPDGWWEKAAGSKRRMTGSHHHPIQQKN